MVGDRLNTDIEFGKNGGLATLLVLTGKAVSFAHSLPAQLTSSAGARYHESIRNHWAKRIADHPRLRDELTWGLQRYHLMRASGREVIMIEAVDRGMYVRHTLDGRSQCLRCHPQSRRTRFETDQLFGLFDLFFLELCRALSSWRSASSPISTSSLRLLTSRAHMEPRI